MKSLNLTDSSITRRRRTLEVPPEKIERAKYFERELPRGQEALVICVKIDGKWHATNMARSFSDGVEHDHWLDAVLTFFQYSELNPTQKRAYELAQI